MLIRSLQLTNFLSFGPEADGIELLPLNVIIGPNGSGKSNLIDAIALLQSAPRDLAVPVREGGGVREWLFKGSENGTPTASLEAVIDYPRREMPLRYGLSFTETGQRFWVADERIEDFEPPPGDDQPCFYFRYEGGSPVIKFENIHLRGQGLGDLHRDQSVLSQRKDPNHYPEITYLGEVFQSIRIYREWSFGRYAAPRLPQKADLPNDFLAADAKNLGLVLNRLRREPAAKKKLLTELHSLYEGIEDFDVTVEGGTVQVFFQENGITVPATRLSDGTLHFLCLLALLCHPNPPRLLCIEEPELGLHPDVLSRLAGILLDASERTQLVVTTHSDILVDALTDSPESVIVCEKENGSTSMRRLNKEELAVWLEKYTLGQLWTRGDIGGTRW